MPVIDCRELHKSYGDRTILDSVTFTIRSGERVGLVGKSGSGKSTTARILAGLEEADRGNIARRRGATFDYLDQEPQLPSGKTAGEVVLASLEEWNEARRRYDELTDLISSAPENLDALIHDQATASETLERLGGWERRHEAEAIIDHLGIDDPDRLVETMSGGERRRVALARLLVGKPDLAILDEPTNHLDVETIEWLEDHLIERFPGALLLITHDRYILDRVATRTLELNRGVMTSFQGGYATYLEIKAERDAHTERVERNRQNFLRRELDWFRSQPRARGTKQKARMARIEGALDQSGPERERSVDLRAGAERLGKKILHLAGLSVERDGKKLIDGLDLDLMQGERIGVVGPNGSGKTSLLLCLLGELEASEGEVSLGDRTRIGYLDQARSGLREDETLREAVAGDRPVVEVAGEDLRVGAYLERFLFDGADQRKKVSVLSGGERARVCLAKLLSNRSNLLLLDEPSNDLDVSTLGALESMLLEFSGSALIVSHDRWFLDRVATSILSFEDGGRLDLQRGSYSEFRARREAQKREEKSEGERSRVAGAGSRKSGEPRVRGSSKPGLGSKPKKLSFAEERELEALMEQIDEAETRYAALEAQLADPQTYRDEGSKVATLSQELESARRDVATRTARWEELEARKASFGSA